MLYAPEAPYMWALDILYELVFQQAGCQHGFGLNGFKKVFSGCLAAYYAYI